MEWAECIIAHIQAKCSMNAQWNAQRNERWKTSIHTHNQVSTLHYSLYCFGFSLSITLLLQSQKLKNKRVKMLLRNLKNTYFNPFRRMGFVPLLRRIHHLFLLPIILYLYLPQCSHLISNFLYIHTLFLYVYTGTCIFPFQGFQSHLITHVNSSFWAAFLNFWGMFFFSSLKNN